MTNTYSRIEREHYNKDREITCERLNITENQYNWLRRKGQILHKIYEDNCNGIIQTDEDYFGMTVPIEKEIKVYLNKVNPKLHVYFQTDPRGATVYVSYMTLKDDNYNQGQCIH
jgi:hypothetical protein